WGESCVRLRRSAVRPVIHESAQLGEQDVVRGSVLGVVFEDSTLEVLHLVGLPVQVALLLELVRDGIALLCQPTMRIPVVQEATIYGFACLRECLAGGLGVGGPGPGC